MLATNTGSLVVERAVQAAATYLAEHPLLVVPPPGQVMLDHVAMTKVAQAASALPRTIKRFTHRDAVIIRCAPSTVVSRGRR